VGLRERKKEQTRLRITESARRLFAERGFDRATVAEIARAAEVSEATVFNYFATKEELFYAGLEAFGAQLVEAVGNRPVGQSVLSAARSVLLGTEGLLDRIAAGDLDALDQARTTARIIAASPALRARELQVHAENADALAAVLSNGGESDLVSHAVANALVGVHRALIDYARRRLLADDRPREIAADLRAGGGRAFGLLENGLGDVGRSSASCVGPPPPPADDR
jgi:AcrR family transcriptional regulator